MCSWKNVILLGIYGLFFFLSSARHSLTLQAPSYMCFYYAGEQQKSHKMTCWRSLEARKKIDKEKYLNDYFLRLI